MVKHILTLLACSFILFSLTGCEDESTSLGSCTDCSDVRVFNIDESKNHFEVSAYGQHMSTPDWDTILSLIHI